MNKLIVFVVLLLVLGGGYLLYDSGYLKKEKPDPTPTPTPTQNTSSNSPERQLTALNSVVKTSIPEIKTESVVEFNSTPANFQFLVPDGNRSSIQVFEITFADNTKGHKAIFEYGANLITTYNFYREFTIAKYSSLEAKRTNDVGILIIEDTGYIYRMDMANSGADNTQITVVSKPK